ncbi:hypothetical protein IJ182_00135 [bacterium]|nr:hypothetical protein [bacterium]
MKEEPKRFEPTKETIRELFAKSGNICAFKGCNHLMIDEDGTFIGQICHIEGVKGERYNPNMSNEERRAPENLMLMCYEHHIKTNNEKIYTVEVLRKMKEEHEKKFSHPEDAILLTFSDHTDDRNVVRPKNLKHFFNVLNYSEDEQEGILDTLNIVIDKLERIPENVLVEYAAITDRIYKMKDNKKVTEIDINYMSILEHDIKSAFRMTENETFEMGKRFESYDLGYAEKGVFRGNEYEQVYFVLKNLDFEWNFFLQLSEFCANKSIKLKSILKDLDFSILDE